ncbi:NAD-dependent protein deacylase [Gallibacter intestinalis]|uniref:NAD-dependent protein deacetylase n=1 Tax=Gallibacter intestinalis TaxID=2779356 RepID=A0ABR9QXN0_9FIRM|nr:NAD-dependent protein deacylase [Gallibacter intestinalis]MBE5035320.1 NAD-dependent protein deacylase [Gallibacter intestinalis]
MNEDIKKLKEIIENSKKIVFFGGAGVSTESNIPDFRSEEGLYNAQQQYGMSPEYMLSHSYFIDNPEGFYDYYKHNLVYEDAKPNKAHYALAKLEQDGKLIAVVTQNVDGLHQKAGSKTVYELHGSAARNYCMDCRKAFDMDYIMDPANCDGYVPKCDKCGGIVKPDVVLYEEALDESQIMGAVNAISQADTLIVGGTSLVVYPAAGLIRYFNGKNLVLINKSSTQYDSIANLVISDSIGKVLGEAVGV